MSNFRDIITATIITFIIVVVATVTLILLYQHTQLMLKILLTAATAIIWYGIYFIIQDKHD